MNRLIVPRRIHSVCSFVIWPIFGMFAELGRCSVHCIAGSPSLGGQWLNIFLVVSSKLVGYFQLSLGYFEAVS